MKLGIEPHEGLGMIVTVVDWILHSHRVDTLALQLDFLVLHRAISFRVQLMRVVQRRAHCLRTLNVVVISICARMRMNSGCA